MLTGWRLFVSKLFIIPQRYILGIMGFFAVLNAYTMRVSLSIAITEMVQRHKSTIFDPNACASEEMINSTSVKTVTDELYPWTPQQQGLILSSFYWGYVLTHVPGGVIAEKFGGKHILGVGILCTSLLTLITPFVIYVTKGNWIWFVALRVLEGFGEIWTSGPSIASVGCKTACGPLENFTLTVDDIHYCVNFVISNRYLELFTEYQTNIKVGLCIGTSGLAEREHSVNFIEGTTYPALNAILSKWVPIGERSKLGTLVYAGSQIGTVMGNSISGALIHSTKTWASVFHFFGALGCLWTFLWTILCYSDPESHPFISDKEKTYLQKKMSITSKEKKDIPWKKILTSVPVWALVVAQIGHDWGFFAMVTDLPTYMKEVLRFNVKDNGLLSSIPYIVMWIVSLGSAYLCDMLIKRKCMTISFARKFFSTIGSFGPGIFLLWASYIGCDRNLAVGMFTIGMGCMGCYYSGTKINVLDLSVHYAGTIMALVNGIGALSGILVPYIISALTEDHTLLQWRIVFWITFAILFITNIVFVLFGSAVIQPFDFNEPERSQGKREEFNGVKLNKREI